MKLDLSAAWDGAIRMISANREVILVLIGLFIFLPNLAVGILVPELESAGQLPAGEDVDFDAVTAAMSAVYAQYWWVVALLGIVQSIGAVAIMSVLGDSARPTVGDAIKRGVALFLSMLAASLLTGLAIGAVLAILIGVGGALGPAGAVLLGLLAVPIALYLLIKFSLASPVIAVEKTANPISAMSRSWRLTKGNSLRIFLFYALLFVALLVVSLVLSLIFGLIFALLGESGELIGSAVFSALSSAIFALIAYAVLVSVHAQLAGGAAKVSVPRTGE